MAQERLQTNKAPLHGACAVKRASLLFVFGLLSVEFLDEIVDGVHRAAWPLIRNDLKLSYMQVGLLLSVPGLTAAGIEIVIGILGDVWNRRALILAGGFFFSLALIMAALSQSFFWLLAAWIIFFPASGAFVNLSQAALMDAEPSRREQNMARWTLAGSLANVAGPLLLGVAVAIGTGWRATFISIAILTLLVLLFVRRFSFPLHGCQKDASPLNFKQGLRAALGALRQGRVVRWLLMIEAGDLMLNVLFGFLALYFVDVVGASEAEAGLAVLVWTGVGLAGDFLLLPLLERVSGLLYLRASACAVLIVFPLFMIVENFPSKLVLLGLLGFCNAGWYAILQARLYEEMPGRSGTVMALANIAGFFNYLAPLALGLFAERFGLARTMWLLMIAPLTLLLGIAHTQRE